MSDNVNHPAHYTSGGIECIDCIRSAVANKPPEQAFLVGNIIKYLYRYQDKNGLEDVQKAEWYLRKLIELLEEEADQYQVVLTPMGTGIKTPWKTLMIPHEGDMFTHVDERRESLLKSLHERGGHCPCQVQQTDDTLCPCTNYRQDGNCVCGLFTKIPQAIPTGGEEDVPIKVVRTDSDTKDREKE